MKIYALSVGGGILAICPLPGSDSDYDGDLLHIGDWAPAMVLSLTTETEMFITKSLGLGADLQARGTRWLHMPIEDMGVPDDAFMAKWADVSEAARRALSGGGRVLLHCRGGCGRSGMVALRLMIEAGEDPEEAARRLRATRDCAIETDAQMEWAKAANRGAATFVRHTD